MLMKWLRQITVVQGQAVAVALLVVTVPALALAPIAARRQILVITLVVTAGIYLLWSVGEESWRRKGIEVGYFALNMGIVVLGLAFSPLWLAAGLIVHGFWDLVHLVQFGGVGTRRVPLWYIFACVTYDWLFGTTIVLLILLT